MFQLFNLFYIHDKVLFLIHNLTFSTFSTFNENETGICDE